MSRSLLAGSEHIGPALGIHAHDNMCLGLVNTLRAHAKGVTWLDATVTGMGRGAGNTRTEDLVIELEEARETPHECYTFDGAYS